MSRIFGQAREFSGRAHKKLANSPLIMWGLGALILLLWFCATVTQIQTSEYLAKGSNQQVTGVAINVFIQPWLLITGQVPLGDNTAFMYAWIVEALTLVVALALIAAFTKIASVNPMLAKIFIGAAVILVILNSWADFSSSPGNNDLVRFLIAAAIGLMVTCGLPLGVGLIEHGFEQY
jgi:hypothetical protein